MERSRFLGADWVCVAVRRMVQSGAIVVGGLHPPAGTSNPVAAQFAKLDDLFAHYPILTLVSYCAGLLFHAAGSTAISSTIRARHLRGIAGVVAFLSFAVAVIGISALVMSLGIPAIGGFQSSGGDDPVRHFLSIRAVQGVLAFPAP